MVCNFALAQRFRERSFDTLMSFCEEDDMDITRDSRVSDVAAARPATVKIFQQYGIDFCCGGKRPLSEACAEHGVDVDSLVTELRSAASGAADDRDWRDAPLPELVEHIQHRFHQPLRAELPRIAGLMAKVLSRHGDHLPEVLGPLNSEFSDLKHDLLQHMAKEDAVLFPAIVSLPSAGEETNAFVGRPIAVMEAEHDEAGRILDRIRRITDDYTPPEWACPTFRGLYHGLAELEREMHLHVHLENNVLFPRAVSLVESR
jgi:regulator of cell morphogenesis and NO signaling